ncbi:MAG: cobalamin biosynthesis protein CobW [Pseudomonadota bacterium]
MKRVDKIPATIVTGFLGAGKTTLISKLLENATGKRIALIVNEFGDVGFDGELLSDCGDPTCKPDSVIELTNGCICCTVADDFLPAMEAIIARDPAPDHIVIETSGLALPQPLVQAFQWPAVKSRITVDGVVTLADAAALADGLVSHDRDRLEAQREADESLDHESEIEELFEDQIACADLIVMSKADLVDAAGLARANAEIDHHKRAGVSVVEASKGAIPASVLLGLEAGAEDDLESRAGHHGSDHHEHDHDAFETFILPVTPALSLGDIKERVAAAMTVHGVLRIKGKASVQGKAAPVIVQAVGPRVEAYFSPAAVAAGSSALVVIGEHDMDRAAIENALLAEPVAA